MAHFTDSELKALKDRALAAAVSGAHLAHAEQHIIALVEMLEQRDGGKKNALKEKAPEAVKVAVADHAADEAEKKAEAKAMAAVKEETILPPAPSAHVELKVEEAVKVEEKVKKSKK